MAMPPLQAKPQRKDQPFSGTQGRVFTSSPGRLMAPPGARGNSAPTPSSDRPEHALHLMRWPHPQMPRSLPRRGHTPQSGGHVFFQRRVAAARHLFCLVDQIESEHSVDQASVKEYLPYILIFYRRLCNQANFKGLIHVDVH